MRYQVYEDLGHLGQDNDIFNEAGQPVLRVDGKAFSLHNFMVVKDLAGTQVAQITRNVIGAIYEISLTGGGSAEMRHHFSLLHPKWTISVSGGQLLEIIEEPGFHKFTVTQNGQPIATVSKAWISVSDTFGVDITEGQNDLLILCCVLSLEAEMNRHSD